VRVVNPTPRDELYALLGLFIEGEVLAVHFCRMFPGLLRKAVDKSLLDDQELREFGALYRAIDRFGIDPTPYTLAMGGNVVQLQAAAITCRDVLAGDANSRLPPPSP